MIRQKKKKKSSLKTDKCALFLLLILILSFTGSVILFFIAIFSQGNVNTPITILTTLTLTATTPTTTETSTTTSTTSTTIPTTTTTTTETSTTTPTTTETSTTTSTTTETSTTIATTITTTTETSTTTPITTTPISTCIGNQIVNPSFETGNLDNWTIPPNIPGETFNTSLEVISGVCDDGTYCLQAGIANTSCTKPGGPPDLLASIVYQPFLVSDCSINISFSYSTISDNTDDRVIVDIFPTVIPQYLIIYTLFDFYVPFGTNTFATYECNICNGECGGYDFGSLYLGQTIFLRFTYISYSTLCGGVLWDNVCLR
jgi:hypothetical protein